MPMPETQDDINRLLFQKIDVHASQLHDLQTKEVVTQQRLNYAEGRHDDLGRQLSVMSATFSEKLDSQGRTITELHNENLRREGAKSQWKLIGTLLGAAYTVMQLAMVIKLFGSGS